MIGKSTVELKKSTIELLRDSKKHPQETYNDVVERMAKMYIAAQKKNQYDEFLHEVQQEKMTELWDNEEDEAWEHASFRRCRFVQDAVRRHS